MANNLKADKVLKRTRKSPIIPTVEWVVGAGSVVVEIVDFIDLFGVYITSKVWYNSSIK